MSNLRDRTLAKSTRKVSEPITVGDTVFRVRELNAAQRMTVLESVDVAASSLKFSVCLPFVTDLIVEVDEPHALVFEPADTQLLADEHPKIVEAAVLEAINVSELGASGAAEAEGNSEAPPSSGDDS